MSRFFTKTTNLYISAKNKDYDTKPSGYDPWGPQRSSMVSIISVDGRRKIKAGVLPTIHLNSPNTRIQSTTLEDHNYSRLSASKDAGSMSLLMGLLAVLVCWAPFLLLFIHLLTTFDDNMITPVEQIKKNTVPASEESNVDTNYETHKCKMDGTRLVLDL